MLVGCLAVLVWVLGWPKERFFGNCFHGEMNTVMLPTYYVGGIFGLWITWTTQCLPTSCRHLTAAVTSRLIFLPPTNCFQKHIPRTCSSKFRSMCPETTHDTINSFIFPNSLGTARLNSSKWPHDREMSCWTLEWSKDKAIQRTQRSPTKEYSTEMKSDDCCHSFTNYIMDYIIWSRIDTSTATSAQSIGCDGCMMMRTWMIDQPPAMKQRRQTTITADEISILISIESHSGWIVIFDDSIKQDDVWVEECNKFGEDVGPQINQL